MLGILGWFGGFFGAEGEELVDEESRSIFGNLGTGWFSDDEETGHGQFRDVLACGLAMVRAYGEALLYNANPATAVDTLSEWELQFGVPQGGRDWISRIHPSVESRQARLLWVCRCSRSSNRYVIDDTLTALDEAMNPDFAMTPWYDSLAAFVAGGPWYYRAYFNAEVVDTSTGITFLWEAYRYLQWVRPAHVQIEPVILP